MDLDHLFVKLDAGRPACRPEDLEAFLALPLGRRVAFTREPALGAVVVRDWVHDGARMFFRTQRTFDAIGWIADGDARPRPFFAAADPGLLPRPRRG